MTTTMMVAMNRLLLDFAFGQKAHFRPRLFWIIRLRETESDRCEFSQVTSEKTHLQDFKMKKQT